MQRKQFDWAKEARAWGWELDNFGEGDRDEWLWAHPDFNPVKTPLAAVETSEGYQQDLEAEYAELPSDHPVRLRAWFHSRVL